MNVRQQLAADLQAAFPKLRVIATERKLAEVKTPTLLIRARSIDLTAGAPLSHRDVGLLLTLISPHLDLDRAADQLDVLAPQLLDWLDPKYLHEAAQLVGYDARLAYDIPTTIIASKEA
ncbi:hypothetical protein [uncultured Microbacterium sp.]|uniref:hypothetical protein n=1 Tax=uncultured Microbacterium sp. TaxID=191216 RepID=UPI0025F7CD64|nr:hypothetical protein [uncultured Microbacterium sp.]